MKLTKNSSVAEVKKEIASITSICEQYGFMDRVVYPYSWAMPIKELIESDGWQNYENYTSASKCQIRQEINGLSHIITEWVKYQLEPDVKIKYLVGTCAGVVANVKKSMADIFLETGLAELA